MIRKFLGLVALTAAIAWLPSCGTGQRLVSIQVTPSTVTFGAADPVLQAQLTATGTYVHPPASKDITSQVTWTSDITQVAQVTSAGIVSPNLTCGIANITATLKTNQPRDNQVTGTMAVTVDGPSAQGCPGGTLPALTVLFAGSGTGVVTSSPVGINCTASCSASFTAGATVTLTAAANSGSTFASWTGCDAVTGQSCTVLLNASRTVTLTIN